MSKRKSLDLLPVIFKTDSNNRFLSGTVDQLIQQPKLKKIDGFIGETVVRNYSPAVDSYINSQEEKSFRTDYELEPGIVTRNAVTDTVEFAKSYEDILNGLKFYGADVSNQDRLFKQQSYTWNPHIDIDKFINYRNYVWLPEGPPTVAVTGNEQFTNTTINVSIDVTQDSEYWKFSNNSIAVNPTITLYRGMTYVFDVDTVDNPFYIKTKRSSGDLDLLEGVLNNGTNKGNVVFEVTDSIPSTIFYVSGKDSTTFGKFLIRNKTENTSLNVDDDIIGKKNYEVTGKFKLSNGMKIRFSNFVMPETYREKTYIVEGVGDSITLVDFESLVTIEGYATEVETSFDESSFDDLPFDQVSDYPVNPDYILINRASKDKNPWSRYNRWFHIDVVTLSSEINGVEPNYGIRANRPIIEFEPNIRLFNFASESKKYVDFLDTKVTDTYSNVEGSVGFFVDGVQLQNGNRVIFTAEKDLSLRNKIFEVQFLDIEGNKKLHLEEVSDSQPLENQGLLVLSGIENGGTTWLYSNGEWVPAQRKTSLNQAPLFDLFDENELSFSNIYYKNSSFKGSKIFGYQIGTGANDTVLGFPLKYSNVSNVGGYLFENFIETESFTYFNSVGELVTVDIRDGFIKINNTDYDNCWIQTNALSIQEIIDQKIATGGEEYLEFNSLNVKTPKSSVRVFKNGDLLSGTEYTISTDVTFDSYFINFNSPLLKDDVVSIRVLPVFDKGVDGKYETPINLINNPLNEVPSSVSYAEINDHVNSIVLNASKDFGFTVDKNNLRDLSKLAPYGRRFVQHQGLLSIAGSMLCDKQVNFISSVRWAALEYQRYKTLILQKFVELPSYTSIATALDDVITEISKDKNVKSNFYYSDMLPYGLNKRDYEYTVRDGNITSYAYGSKIFNSTNLSNNSILVYLNNELLIKDIDYTFDTIEPLVNFKRQLSVNSKIVIKYYNNIYGSCMPYSPTKLGLYPSFVPEIYEDNTYIEPTQVLQGHDGSITVCYGDDRDLLLLELEKRIYNNLNSFYDTRIFDIIDVTPGVFRNSANELNRVNRTIEEEFLRWTGLYNIDYENNSNEIYGSNFSYNFVSSVNDIKPDVVLNGSWRKIYRYYFDTDRPHTHPWEMLGFSNKPTWWEDEYGPSPYSSGNDVLWKDLEEGYIRQGDRQGYDDRYKRPGLLNIIPVDPYGELKDPFDVGVVRYFDFSKRYDKWSFGDMGPAEASWRRSHLYPFAVQIAMALNLPAKYLTLCFDTSRNSFNKANQIVYKDTHQRIAPKDLKIFSDTTSGFVFATGYSPYIVEYLRLKNEAPALVLKNYINNIKSNLIYKVGGFTSKDKFNVALETVTSYKTVDKVFIPEENYQLFLSTGNPIKTLSMSGIIVERGSNGFVIKGYDNYSPYFKIKKAISAPNDPVVTVGGTTESFIYWASNANITGGTIVSVGQKYYRAVSTHLTRESFDPALYYPLPYLPTIGGIDATVASTFEDAVTIIPYGTVMTSTQEVFNFILGYGSYLESEGFIFDKVLSDLEVVADWKLAGKEFLFWSIQNWANNSVISLAPFADTVKFYNNKSVVDDINDLFYNYSLLKSDGSAVDKNKITIVREENTFSIDTSKISNDGIYFVKINLVQKEHIVVFDNFTIFNDLVYQPYSGYRQSRFKVSGYVTDNWTGDFYVPGFIYDSAKIDDWQANIDYSIGDVVKYQTKYYQARYKLLPSEKFNYEDWSELGKAPVAQLLPNFEYKITQFEEFYSLDSENFDDSQKKFAQKLIGYVPRKYLNSLIVDETSQYKFYQGFIKEKGTIAPLEKFSVASNEALGSHVSIQEEWAIRLGTFGGENTYKEIEFSLDQNKFNQDPQLFEFIYGDNVATSPRSYLVDQSSLLIKPIDFKGTPWPTLDVNSSNGTNYLQYQKLPTAGYPRIDDVTFTALYENNILSLGASGSLQEGDTVWVAMDKKGDWSVKRYTKATAKIINYQVDNANNLIQFITDVAHNLELRDFVSISRLQDPLNGVYEVIGIDTPTTFVVSTTFNDIPDAEAALDGSLYYFLTTRFSNLDELASIPGIARWRNCEFVWVDDDGTGNWVVLEKESAGVPTPIRPFKEDFKQYFGQSIALAPESNLIVISATNVENGRIYIYRRDLLGSSDIQLDQSYIVEENVSDILSVQNVKDSLVVEAMPRNHGASIDIWENTSLTTRYIVSGAPNATGVKWIAPGVTFENEPFRKPVAFEYSSSGIFDEGLIKIVKYDSDNLEFVTDIVLASPVAERASQFGHMVKIIGDTTPFILVSSPGQDQKTGSVFAYYLDGNQDWQVVLLNNAPFDFRSRVTQISQGSEFGWDIATSKDGNTVVISAPYYLKDRLQAHTGAVFVFQKDAVNYTFTLQQSIYADDFIEPGDLLLKGITKSYSNIEATLVFDATDFTLTRNRGNFIQDGFRTGQTVQITGSRFNNYEFVIDGISASVLTFKANDLMANENVTSPITIIGLGTARKDRFGDKLAMTADGKTLMISSDHASQSKLDAGMVYVLNKNSSGQYVLGQKISSPSLESGELFGSNLSVSPDGSLLLVSAAGGDQASNMYFDSYVERVANSLSLYGSEYVLNSRSALRPLRTTFDSGSTRFVDKAQDSGIVYLYQKLGDYFVFGESLVSGDTSDADGYGVGLATDGRFCAVGAPRYEYKVEGQDEFDATKTSIVTYTDAGTVILFDNSMAKYGFTNSWSWSKVRYQEDGLVDIDKVQKVISYNTSTLSVLENYEIYDPVKGKIPSKVIQEIKYITPYDPAVYTVAVSPGNKNRVDNKTTWTNEHVGELWLDTSTLRYVWYEQGSADFRINNWGKLFPGATVDVYEWVKSDYRPSEWATLADTEDGLSQGISGQPKNPDNSVVSINQYFDPIINDFVNVYYFWVRNKITIPDLSFRTISSFECARIIEDPKTQGIKYAAFLSPRSLALANTKKDLDAKKINVDIYYRDSDQEINRHSHWQLINENNRYAVLDPVIERKLFDSLVGQDTLGNLVPDPTLSPKLRYGVLNNPRQSWFVDREKALKTLISFINKILLSQDVVGKVNLDNINKFDSVPLESYGFYDEVVETKADLSSIGTAGKKRAVLEPEIVNGRLVNVTIVDSGVGYKIAPTVEIIGSGTGAKIQTAIDLSGKLTSVKILSQGINYTDDTRLLVRPYSVLVTLDEDIDKWAIYQSINNIFERKISQIYDVRKYWSYVDWVASDYSAEIPPKFVVDFTSELNTNTFAVGDTVKIRNTGDGRSIILRKTETGIGNYLNDYEIIYRESGTIQFSSKLYNKQISGLGFDSFVGFDQNSFDESNAIEIRKILQSVKDDIFVGDLAQYWNKFVFVAIKYVLSEQLFVDWIYKTSFITPIIDAGLLDQKEIYRFNDFSYVEEFIKEIKPYRSKFREITTAHQVKEHLGVGVTDFDLPAYVDTTGKIVLPTGALIDNVYPFKHWSDNKGFKIKSIDIANPGNGYRIPPQVVINPAQGDSGSGATAIARISNGKLSEIVVTNSGSGYLATPKVVIVGGGNYDTNFVQATASAKLFNDYIRTSEVKLKYDRVSEKGLFTGQFYSRNFVTDGITLNYVLTYPVDELDDNYPAMQDKETIKIYLNEVEISEDAYRVTFRTDLSTVITFNVALPTNQNLRIQYIKNFLYTKDVFEQSLSNYKDTFQLTFPPELDNQKIVINTINSVTKVGYTVPYSDYVIQLKQVEVNKNKFVGYIKFKNVPSINSIITIQYVKNINIQNAVDRIITSYQPTTGMPGKDITQLMKGVEFGGVQIQGLNFSVSSGWDGLPWFTQGWDTFVNDYKDLLVISDGTTNTYNLGYVPLLGTQINVYFDGVRVDDEYFGTPNQKNSDALFKTIIANGASNTITLPVIPENDVKIEVRQSLSDGVTLPTDDFVLDTSLNGGDFTTIKDALETRFRTATGLRPDDISVDGGQFLSIEHSPSTEELVKGEIFDTLSMTVFNSPSSGSNLIKTYQYFYDGTNPSYEINGAVDSRQSIDVYVNNFVLDRETEFTITSLSNGNTLITLTTNKYGLETANTTDKISVTIQNMAIGGSNILNRVNYIVTNQDSTSSIIEIDTNLNIDDIGSYYVSIPNTTSLEKKSTRSKRAKVVITNSPELGPGSLVTIILFSSSVKTYSEVYNQELIIDANDTYTLTRPPGNIEPLHVMAAVTRLTPSNAVWLGVWKDNFDYALNDTVLFNNRSYVCIDAHKSYYSLSGVLFSSWVLANAYSIGDIVNYGESRYICITAHTSNNTTNVPTNNLLWALHVGNRPDEDYSNSYWELLPTQRLLPPETEYYEVTQDSQTFELGKNFPYLSRSLSISDIEVYRNGKMMATNRDFEFDNVTNSVTLSSGVAFVGDVIAISVLRGADYTIKNGAITFTRFANLEIDQKIVVTTYTNHDENLMRREVFKGLQLQNEYKVSRTVLSINNVWVDLNGRPLIPNIDYDVRDNQYIKLSDKFNISDTDRIVITSISEISSVDPIAYRLFKDMTNGVQFKRISKKNTTYLTQALEMNDREIFVNDASIFGEVIPNSPKPGVIFIAGERIEFKSVSGNTLGNITRGTSGTGVAETYPIGSKILNVAQSETVPYREGSVVQTFVSPSNYRYNEELDQFQKYVNGQWTSNDVESLGKYVLSGFNFNDSVSYEDQITVYMAGRVLLKPAKAGNPLIKHDFSITFDSDETNSQGQTGDVEIEPDFTISKINNEYVLQINTKSLMRDESNNIIPDLQIRLIQKTGKIWYTLGGKQTLQQDSTIQAKFLQELSAELPDRYYYATRTD